MTDSRKRRIETPRQYSMSIKKCRMNPIMTLRCSMDDYVAFRHAINSCIAVRLKRAKCLGVKSCFRIVTERIHIPLKNSVGTIQRLSRTVLV